MKEFWEYFKENIKKIFKDLRSKDKNVKRKQLPNILTLIRGIVAPITIIPAVLTNHVYFAFIMIAICSLTDSFDGWYARNYDAQSEFGALLDAVCDKLFVLTLAFPLVFIHTKWIVAILVLEFIISVINSHSKLKGYVVKSSIMGKVKTVVLDFTIALCYLNFIFHVPRIFLKITVILTNLMQLFSIIGYYLSYKKQNVNSIQVNNI